MAGFSYFYAFVRRRETYPEGDLYAWSIRRKLPKVPIPLKGIDEEVALDLDEAFKATFNSGGYSRRVRYDVPLPGNLSEADREWVKSILAKPA